MAPCDFFRKEGERVCPVSFVLLQVAWRKDLGGEQLATANCKILDTVVCGFATIKVIWKLSHLAFSGSVSVVLSFKFSWIAINVPKGNLWSSLATVAHRSCHVGRVLHLRC